MICVGFFIVAMTARATSKRLNVSDRLTESARQWPDRVAVAMPGGRAGRGGADRDGGRHRDYRQVTFAELEADVARIARGLVALGVRPGTRLVLLVRPGIDFVALVFALLRSGAVAVLIDPGMGRRHLVRCLADVEPDGFVAIPPVQAVRAVLRRRFAGARLNVTVGRRWFWAGPTLNDVRRLGESQEVALPQTHSDDPAAIIFTSGSTGPPKGVLYRQRNFDAQVREIGRRYEIEPGEIDLPGFPLFGLFNAAMGVTTVIPEMDPSRPARVDPAKIVRAARDWRVTQAFGSPAIWDRVGRYCQARGQSLPSLRRVLSAGAPVPAGVLRRMREAMSSEAEMHTPYGATEALPVASISAREVLDETSQETDRGAGVCVGHRFAEIEWRVIRIVDGPVRWIDEVEVLPAGEIGELIVTGPQVTDQYATRTEWNERSKIAERTGDGKNRQNNEQNDRPRVWHRMGDCGYFDPSGRFWICGRVAHRVLTRDGPMYPVCCEAVFNTHAEVYRTALVGVGPVGAQRPVLVVEPISRRSAWPRPAVERIDTRRLLDELRERALSNELTRDIETFLFHRSLPVDIRHNAKIDRERLARWAVGRLGVPPHKHATRTG